MSFLTLLRRVAMTLLFILLPAASGWACTPVFVRGQASTLRLNVGQLTVPADARPGTPLYHKSFAWNRLSDGGEQWIRCADDPHGLSPLLLDSLRRVYAGLFASRGESPYMIGLPRCEIVPCHFSSEANQVGALYTLSLIHISEPTRPY